jgi:hypothetical protein
MDEEYNLVEVGIFTSSGGFRRNRFIDVFDIKKIRKRYKNKGICTTVFKYNTKDQDKSLLVGDFYLDLDAENNIEKAKQDAISSVSFIKNVLRIPEEYIHIYFSGQKGFHITVPYKCFGIQPCKNLNLIYKEIAIDIKNFTDYKSIDIQIYDNKRMYRLPGSIHQKTGLHKIPLLYHELRILNESEIKELAKKRRKISFPSTLYISEAHKIIKEYEEKVIEKNKQLNKKRKTEQVLKYTPPCIKSILENGENSGNRNNTCAILASHYKERGFTLAQILEIVQDWNSEKCLPPLVSREVQQTVKSIFNNPKSYGCTTLKQLYICPGTCKLKKQK